MAPTSPEPRNMRIQTDRVAREDDGRPALATLPRPDTESPKPLTGLRILDLSRMIAGGVAGMLLADFGADIVKVEQPGIGDPLRQWTTNGEPYWWKVYGRNKRYITLNLKSDEGRALLRSEERRVGSERKA